MNKRAGSVLRLATPLKAWAQRFAFGLLIGAAFGLMILGKTDSLMVERLRSQIVDSVAPLLEAVSQPIASVNRAVENARHLAELRQINGDLREQNERLTAWHRHAIRLEAENAALRSLLKVAPDPAKSYVTARVIADTGSVYVRSVLVAAGQADGLAKNQTALSGEGLAGRVAEVGARASRILLVTDINSRIPVLVGPARDQAVLAGDNSAQPNLLYLAPGTSLKPGDRVVTSGHGGVFPPGLAVGVVAAVGDTGVRVRPYVDWGHLEYLRLVNYDLPQRLSGLDGVGPTHAPD